MRLDTTTTRNDSKNRKLKKIHMDKSLTTEIIVDLGAYITVKVSLKGYIIE